MNIKILDKYALRAGLLNFLVKIVKAPFQGMIWILWGGAFGLWALASGLAQMIKLSPPPNIWRFLWSEAQEFFENSSSHFLKHVKWAEDWKKRHVIHRPDHEKGFFNRMLRAYASKEK